MSRVVIIAIDDSPHAEAAFMWYVKNLHQPCNRIVILHSAELSFADTADYEVQSEACFTHMWHQQRGKIKALEDQYRWKLNENGLAGKIRTESGKPGDIIVQVAKEENAAMIVIGSRGLSKLKRTFQGSVSDHVLHRAHCPVCICKKVEPE